MRRTPVSSDPSEMKWTWDRIPIAPGNDQYAWFLLVLKSFRFGNILNYRQHDQLFLSHFTFVVHCCKLVVRRELRLLKLVGCSSRNSYQNKQLRGHYGNVQVLTAAQLFQLVTICDALQVARHKLWGRSIATEFFKATSTSSKNDSDAMAYAFVFFLQFNDVRKQVVDFLLLPHRFVVAPGEFVCHVCYLVVRTSCPDKARRYTSVIVTTDQSDTFRLKIFSLTSLRAT